jgi:uncharacterized protein
MPKSVLSTSSATRREVLQALASTAALTLPASRVKGEAPSPISPPGALPFELTSVRLLPGPFAAARDLDARYLLSLEPDRLLHNFRVNAGLEPKATVYGGWESQEPWVEIRCQGHTLGHYLSACAMMASAAGNERLQERVAYIVNELAACQRAGGSGLICAFPDGATQLENALAGRPITGVPWYTVHKVMAGLRDAYSIAQNQQALQVLRLLADWIDNASRSVDEARFQKMLEVEHGGMNEVLADLAAITSERRYLMLAERFNHHALLDPLSAQRDVLDGLHSNTQIPKVVGFARLHELTGNERYATAAKFFWRNVTQERSFATGGHGDREHFFPASEFAQHLGSAKTMETCCTHNMLRLTRALFLKQPVSTYGDYYERALFNGILASQDPAGGGFTYFQATRPGYPKLYCTPIDSFWCCTGTGMENHAKYGDSIYFQSRQVLYVNLFIASELTWRDKGVTLTQLTRFPDEPGTRLSFRMTAPTRLRLKIRHPEWCARVTCKLNGRIQAAIPGADGYLEINRLWRDGDVIDVEIPMEFRVAALPGSPDIAAVMYGPLVLAARCGTAGMTPGADIIVNERTSGDMLKTQMDLPRLDVTADTLSKRLVRETGGPLSFSLKTRQQQFELIPYYRIAHERYSLYWRYRPATDNATST